MANLFLVHTPFQLFVAQQIINQENCRENILVYGYMNGCYKFVEIYRLMMVPEYWSKSICIKNINNWADISHKHLLSDSIRTYKTYKQLWAIIENNNVKDIFLGDLNNYSVKFLAKLMNRKNVRVNIFEEGTNHYRSCKTNRKGCFLLNSFFALTWNCVYFIPFFRMKYGNYCFLKDDKIENSRINCRYSIIPFYKEIFDKVLKPQKIFSPALKEYIEGQISLIDNDSVLFLTQPVYELLHIDSDLYIETIRLFFHQANHNQVVVVKFHPRESLKDKHSIENILQDEGYRYIVIGGHYNIPIEYYLQFVSFKSVICLISSTMWYNGYIFPKTLFISIIDLFKDLCAQNRIDTTPLQSFFVVRDEMATLGDRSFH